MRRIAKDLSSTLFIHKEHHMRLRADLTYKIAVIVIP